MLFHTVNRFQLIFQCLMGKSLNLSQSVSSPVKWRSPTFFYEEDQVVSEQKYKLYYDDTQLSVQHTVCIEKIVWEENML